MRSRAYLVCVLGVLMVLAQAPACRADDPSEDTDDDSEEAEEPEVVFNVETTFMPKTCGRKSAKNDKLTMHYTGYLHKGHKKFDSSRDRAKPFTFQIGIGQVIVGWDMGLLDMCVGEQRRLTIPPALGYGSKGSGDRIPPMASLVFETELVEIEDGIKKEDIFEEMDKDNDGRVSKDEIVDWVKEGAKNHASPEEQKQLLLDPQPILNMADNILKKEDKNRDGYLTWDEVKDRWTDEL